MKSSSQIDIGAREHELKIYVVRTFLRVILGSMNTILKLRLAHFPVHICSRVILKWATGLRETKTISVRR